MKEFRTGSSRVLITTDLLARGIDVQQVSLGKCAHDVCAQIHVRVCMCMRVCTKQTCYSELSQLFQRG